MRSRKKFFPFLFLGLLSLAGLVFYIFFIDPQDNFNAGTFYFSPIILFLVLLFTTASCLFTFLLMNTRRGILLGFLVSAILLLRFFGFTSILYIIILLVIVLLLELGFRKH